MEVKGPNNTKHLVTFVGTLMVPDTSLPTQCDFIWLGTVRSEDNTVNILAFHTDDKNDFAKILTKYLKKLNDLQPSKNVQHQIDFIKQTLFELSSSLYVKTPPRDLFTRRGGKENETQDPFSGTGDLHFRRSRGVLILELRVTKLRSFFLI